MALTKFKNVTVQNGESSSVSFGTKVLNAGVAIQGFNVAYSGDDHHVKKIVTKAHMDSVSDDAITVSAECTMEDDEGNKATGSLDILVIAECDA